MSVKVSFEVAIPMVPNFLRLVAIQDEPASVDIAKLSDAELSDIADAWKLALLTQAKQRRIEAENSLRQQLLMQGQASR